jgi:hypothetical protein
MIRHIVLVLTALSLGWASVVAARAQSNDLILEKKTFELPSYTTVAGETIKSVKNRLGGCGYVQCRQIERDFSHALLFRHEPRIR